HGEQPIVGGCDEASDDQGCGPAEELGDPLGASGPREAGEEGAVEIEGLVSVGHITVALGKRKATTVVTCEPRPARPVRELAMSHPGQGEGRCLKPLVARRRHRACRAGATPGSCGSRGPPDGTELA